MMSYNVISSHQDTDLTCLTRRRIFFVNYAESIDFFNTSLTEFSVQVLRIIGAYQSINKED